MGALMSVLSSTPVIGAVLGGLGTARRWAPEVMGKFANVFFGGTQDEALSLLGRAAYDPKFKALLMERPNPDGVQAIWDMAKQTPATAAGRAAVVTTPAAQDETAPLPRKSGGRVVRHADKAEKLITAAERAKRFHVKHTEPLLNKSDSAITSALKIANDSI
jgi:hypothetical protein